MKSILIFIICLGFLPSKASTQTKIVNLPVIYKNSKYFKYFAMILTDTTNLLHRRVKVVKGSDNIDDHILLKSIILDTSQINIAEEYIKCLVKNKKDLEYGFIDKRMTYVKKKISFKKIKKYIRVYIGFVDLNGDIIANIELRTKKEHRKKQKNEETCNQKTNFWINKIYINIDINITKDPYLCR